MGQYCRTVVECESQRRELQVGAGSTSRDDGRRARRHIFVALLGFVASCPATEETDPFAADCRAWCSKRGACGVVMDTDDVIDRCTDSCVDAIELGAPKFGQECVDVYEEVMKCLAEVSCEEYSA